MRSGVAASAWREKMEKLPKALAAASPAAPPSTPRRDTPLEVAAAPALVLVFFVMSTILMNPRERGRRRPHRSLLQCKGEANSDRP